jgi:hypothetical protein
VFSIRHYYVFKVRRLKTRSMKILRVLVVSFLVSTMFSHVSGWPRASANWDVPPSPAPIVVFDLYTQRGGVGSNMPGGQFEAGENVTLYVKMTSGDSPVEGNILFFEISGPTNSYQNISILLTVKTNSSGIALTTFMIPPLDFAQSRVLGTWCVTAQTGLDIDTVGDALNFEVVSMIHAPEFPIVIALLLACILTTATGIILKRKLR